MKIGQKVICVNDKGSPTLVLSEIYTISGFTPGGVKLYEVIPLKRGCNGFWAWRFRPIEEKGDMTYENIMEFIDNTGVIK